MSAPLQVREREHAPHVQRQRQVIVLHRERFQQGRERRHSGVAQNLPHQAPSQRFNVDVNVNVDVSLGLGLAERTGHSHRR